MSYWDSDKQEVVKFQPVPYPDYPGWLRVDCGCCAGIEWGGESPTECTTCKGSGALAKHSRSGALALYPGGPFCG